MAGKAVGREFGVTTNERSGTHHKMRVDEGERHQRQQVGRDDGQDPATLHFQPQNRNTATICASASTANANVIGK